MANRKLFLIENVDFEKSAEWNAFSGIVHRTIMTVLFRLCDNAGWPAVTTGLEGLDTGDLDGKLCAKPCSYAARRLARPSSIRARRPAARRRRRSCRGGDQGLDLLDEGADTTARERLTVDAARLIECASWPKDDEPWTKNPLCKTWTNRTAVIIPCRVPRQGLMLSDSGTTAALFGECRHAFLLVFRGNRHGTCGVRYGFLGQRGLESAIDHFLGGVDREPAIEAMRPATLIASPTARPPAAPG